MNELTSGLSTRRRMGTRDAVETAIELSKRDRSSTWEELALRRGGRWDPDLDHYASCPDEDFYGQDGLPDTRDENES